VENEKKGEGEKKGWQWAKRASTVPVMGGGNIGDRIMIVEPYYVPRLPIPERMQGKRRGCLGMVGGESGIAMPLKDDGRAQSNQAWNRGNRKQILGIISSNHNHEMSIAIPKSSHVKVTALMVHNTHYQS